ncbi:MAG: RNHCP domain-containing protein [Phycisphaeraceae bacterium]|nr:MAG: RNHCP domain-containing protein [Phycisphaeraceae bacterium]
MPSQSNRRGRGAFTCVCCKLSVPTEAFGTKHRNHCPSCLWSRHVDEEIGDRRASCNQPMEPIAIAVAENGEWAIVHRCTGCGRLRRNRIAGDDSEMALLKLALRPLANPAFPLDGFSPSSPPTGDAWP